MKFAYHGGEKVKIEADTTRVEPVSSKPPPPKPPSTYSRDKPVGKGAEREKAQPEETQTQKGAAAKGMIQNEKKPKGDARGRMALPKVGEEDRDASSSRYSWKTARGAN